jgi:anti-anti-sigma factor
MIRTNEEGHMLTVSTERIGNIATLRCKGGIVLGDETALLCQVLGQKTQNVVLELAEVDAIDTAGIGALISLQAAGIYLKLMNPTERVKEILRLTHLDSIFEICQSQLSGATDSMQTGASWRVNRPMMNGHLKAIEVVGT